MDPFHTPVMVREVVELLARATPGVVLDATVGGGGHALALLEASEHLRVVGLDLDEEALAAAHRRLSPFGRRCLLTQGDFAEVRKHLARLGLDRVDGLLLDLGLSSHQLETPGRGFSFERPGPLDMRFDTHQSETLEGFLGRIGEEELTRIIHDLGEEPQARRIASEILIRHRQRRLSTTVDLARTVAGVIGRRHPSTRHPATATFRALRMALNQELERLQAILAALPQILSPGGRAVVLTYHSLEDRLTKQRLRDLAREGRLSPLTRKARRPLPEEVSRNPRARSARLRAAETVVSPEDESRSR